MQPELFTAATTAATSVAGAATSVAGAATSVAGAASAINQSNVFIKPFLHQLMSQSAVQKPSIKPQTASNAGVEAQWLGKTL
jgi:hypothetical protein